MNTDCLVSKDIHSFYTHFSEENRLSEGMGIFEFERVKSLIARYLSDTPQTIVDVGGGTGKYAEWLSLLGHEVHLIDPIPKHIEQANNRSDRLPNGFRVQLGEAQNLDIMDEFADLVLLHGPLYHLQDRKARIRAILEAKRIAKSNAIILGFAINYTASTLVGLLNGMVHQPAFFIMCQEELTTGIHMPPIGISGLLAEAYYHRPEELRHEFEEVGLDHLSTLPVEGMAWLDKDYFVNMLNKKTNRTLSQLIRVTEADATLLAFSPHMMIATKKTNHDE